MFHNIKLSVGFHPITMLPESVTQVRQKQILNYSLILQHFRMTGFRRI
jgi:hypothetical protein